MNKVEKYLIKIMKYLFLFVVSVFLLWLSWIFIQGLSKSEPEIQAGLIGLLGMLFVALFTHYFTKTREINARLFREKRDGYMNFMDVLFDMLRAMKLKGEINNEEYMGKIVEFKKALMIWGSDDVIRKWNLYEIDNSENQSIQSVVSNIEMVLRAIRKDLGHNDKSLEEGQLVGLILDADAKKSLDVGRK